MIYGELAVKYNERRKIPTLQEVRSMTYDNTTPKEQKPYIKAWSRICGKERGWRRNALAWMMSGGSRSTCMAKRGHFMRIELHFEG